MNNKPTKNTIFKSLDVSKFMQYSYFPLSKTGDAVLASIDCLSSYNLIYNFNSHELVVKDKMDSPLWSVFLRITPMSRHFITVIGKTPYILEFIGHTFNSILVSRVDLEARSVRKIGPVIKRRYNGTLVFVDNIIHKDDNALLAFGDCKASHVKLNTSYKALVIAGYFILDEDGIDKLFYSIHWRLGQIFIKNGIHIHQSEGIAKICMKEYKPRDAQNSFKLINTNFITSNIVRHFPGFRIRLLSNDAIFFTVSYYQDLVAGFSMKTHNMTYSMPLRIVDEHSYEEPFPFYYNSEYKNAPLAIASKDSFNAYLYPPSLYSSEFDWDIVDSTANTLKIKTVSHSGIEIFATYSVALKGRSFNYSHVSFPSDMLEQVADKDEVVLITDFPAESPCPRSTFMFTIKGPTHSIVHASVITIYNDLNSLLKKVAETSGPFNEESFVLILERNDQLKLLTNEIRSQLFSKDECDDALNFKDLFADNKIEISQRDQENHPILTFHLSSLIIVCDTLLH